MMIKNTETNNQEKDIWQGFSHLVKILINKYGWTKIPLLTVKKNKMTEEEYKATMKKWSEQYDTSSFQG
jgi:hypothetical protein